MQIDRYFQRRDSVAPPSGLCQNKTLGFSLLFATFLLILLANLVNTAGVLRMDLRITAALQSLNHPAVTKAMAFISWFGYSPQSYVLVVLSLLLLFCLRMRREAILLAVSVFCAQELDRLVKILVRHPRPTVVQAHVYLRLRDYSFPSGHVVFYTVFFGFLIYLILNKLSSRKRAPLIILFSLPILLVGLSRIYLGEHWTSDVIGGYMLGDIVLTVFILTDKAAMKFRPSRSR